MGEQSSYNKKCIKCKEIFEYTLEDAWWDYQGLTDVKLIKCSKCGCIQAIQYKEPINPNYDRRYYD